MKKIWPWILGAGAALVALYLYGKSKTSGPAGSVGMTGQENIVQNQNALANAQKAAAANYSAVFGGLQTQADALSAALSANPALGALLGISPEQVTYLTKGADAYTAQIQTETGANQNAGAFADLQAKLKSAQDQLAALLAAGTRYSGPMTGPTY